MGPLRAHTSLWAMPPQDQSAERSELAEIDDKVAEACRHGMAMDLGAAGTAVVDEVAPMMARAGLTPLIIAFPKSVVKSYSALSFRSVCA